MIMAGSLVKFRYPEIGNDTRTWIVKKVENDLAVIVIPITDNGDAEVQEVFIQDLREVFMNSRENDFGL